MRGSISHEAPVSAAIVPAVSKKLLLYSITSLRLSTIVCAVGGSMVMARFLMNMVHEPFSPTLSFAFRVWVLWQKALDGATLIVRKSRGSLPVSHLQRCRPWSPAQEQIKGTDMDITLSWWAALLGLPLAIILILRKRNTTYARMSGAIVGCLVGGPSPGADCQHRCSRLSERHKHGYSGPGS